jgi:hypothetical protein
MALEHVQQLDGSERAKQRMTTLLKTLQCDCSVGEACAQLGLSESHFHAVRHHWLQDALQLLEPHPPGRRPKERRPECERIEQLELHDERFEVPEDYSAAELTGAAFGLIDDGATQQVELQFDQEIAHLIRERVWHPDQELEKSADDSLILRFTAAGDKEILAWIYSFIPYVKVLGPESLKEQFVAGMRSALDYQTNQV